MKEFYINDDGIRLHAKLDMPEGYREGERCPLALVIHGLTGDMEERHVEGAAKCMNAHGIASLRVEMYGHGMSDGDFEKHNLFKWLNNALTAAEYAKTLDFATDYYVMGHSQGGLTALMLAGMMPELFKAAILLSPAAVITDGSRTGSMFGLNFDPSNLPEDVWVEEDKKVGSAYLRAAQVLDADWAIDHYKNPVLIVHGEEDEAVPVSYAYQLQEKYADAELTVISDETHCYDRHFDEVIKAVGAFVESVK